MATAILSSASTVFASTLALVCNCTPVCSSFNDQTAGQRTYSLSPPQGIFALQKSLRGDCGGDGVPSAVGNSSPRAKKFPEEICFAPSRVCQVCRTPDYRAFKSTQHAQPVQPSVPGSPGARGAAPLCFRRSPEETLSRVSFGQFLRGGSTPRFFAQLRSVGSKNEPAGRSLPDYIGACRHGRQNKKRRAAFAAPPSYYRGTIILTAL